MEVGALLTCGSGIRQSNFCRVAKLCCLSIQKEAYQGLSRAHTFKFSQLYDDHHDDCSIHNSACCHHRSVLENSCRLGLTFDAIMLKVAAPGKVIFIANAPTFKGTECTNFEQLYRSTCLARRRMLVRPVGAG